MFEIVERHWAPGDDRSLRSQNSFAFGTLYGGHTNFYSIFLLKALDAVRPGGGLVFVIPTSFVAGPYFSGLREEILARADVVSLDLHQDREGLFLGAVQDVCLLVLRRHEKKKASSSIGYEAGILHSNGARSVLAQIGQPARISRRPFSASRARNYHRSSPLNLAARRRAGLSAVGNLPAETSGTMRDVPLSHPHPSC